MNPKANAQPVIILSGGRISGQGWTRDLKSSGLPAAAELEQLLPDDACQPGPLSLLLDDDLLHPLRVQLDEKPAKAELDHFLLWKLKRILPYPVDQVAVRHTPLPESNTWLTMTLPKRWTEEVFELFARRDVHLGHIGGLFTTLLESHAEFRKRPVLALFGDFYLLAALDAKGAFRTFRTRRLPLTDKGGLDFKTLVQMDLAPVMTDLADGQGALILCLDPRHDQDTEEIRAGLEAHVGSVTVPRLTGDIHARVSVLQQTGGA